MLGFIAFIIKVVIGGVISYILPSLLKKNISHPDHLKISCIGVLSTAIFSVSIQMEPDSSYMLSAGAMILIGFLEMACMNLTKGAQVIHHMYPTMITIGANIHFLNRR